MKRISVDFNTLTREPARLVRLVRPALLHSYPTLRP